MMTVQADGRPAELPDGATVATLLDALGLAGAVELVRAVAGG